MRLAKIKKTYLVAATALAVGAMICLPQFASAAVTGQCSNCHTMHNSQNNLPMTYNGKYTSNPIPNSASLGSTTPNGALLRGNCIQCHTGKNSGGLVTDSGTVPFVSSLSDPTGKTLAGGSFYWVDQSTDSNAATYGHNVDMLPNHRVDDNLTYPPGFPGGSSAAWATQISPESAHMTGILTCAGAGGCHGNRTNDTATNPVNATNNFSAVHGLHHAASPTGLVFDGSSLKKSYRFLDGIAGIEDPDWEYSVTNSAHNEYYGVARSGSAADSDAAAHSISHLCAECHGAFHDTSAATYTSVIPGISSAGDMTSPWIRHPTDFDMNGLGGEYANYGGAGVNNYMPQAPVASDNLANGVLSKVLQTPGDAIVTCISCHRAHGSPYADLLRWDYTGMIAGPSTTSGQATGTGCFVCHTTKDGV